MATQALLEVADLHKRFGGLAAVAGVSFRVAAGSIHGLIGPNGSGKTTVFNVITGFIAADSGDVRFRGIPLGGLSPDAIARHGICRTFQHNLNPAHMTVMENMLLAPQGQTGESILGAAFSARRVRRQEREHLALAYHILDTVHLGDRADVPAGTLSGGQKKLLALAQALMAQPQLILLDEPVAGVNPRLIEDIVEIIHRLGRQGQTFLIVEHNMQVVRRLCDRLCVLVAGSVLAEGPPEEILAREDVLRAFVGTRGTRGNICNRQHRPQPPVQG